MSWTYERLAAVGVATSRENSRRQMRFVHHAAMWLVFLCVTGYGRCPACARARMCVRMDGYVRLRLRAPACALTYAPRCVYESAYVRTFMRLRLNVRKRRCVRARARQSEGERARACAFGRAQVGEYYFDYDGFVIIHGTDTISYTASALSFMLEGLGKAVVLTGSIIPMCEPFNDARRNLIASIMFASQLELSEVRVSRYDSSNLECGAACVESAARACLEAGGRMRARVHAHTQIAIPTGTRTSTRSSTRTSTRSRQGAHTQD
eukprot:3469246-Pleurochrysis_carterae.AAC.1